MSVSAISAYLAFFPVAVGALRGLRSPPRGADRAAALLRRLWWQTLVRLRLPASVPYLIPALKLAAAASVVGAIVAEISIGLPGGIGRLIITYAQQATGDPSRVYAPIIGAAVMGLVAVGCVSLLDVALRRYHAPRRRRVTAPAAVDARGRRQALRRRARPRSQARDRHRPDGRGGRVRLADRPVGLRQVDAAADHRRTSSSRPTARCWSTASRRGRRAWTRTTASPSSRRGCSSGGRCRATSSCRWSCTGSAGAAARAGAGAAGARRPVRLRRAPPEPAVGRDAAAGGDRPRARPPPVAAADGRAVRRAGRDDARAHAGRADPDLRGDERGGRLRHALHPRGGVPLRSAWS